MAAYPPPARTASPLSPLSPPAHTAAELYDPPLDMTGAGSHGDGSRSAYPPAAPGEPWAAGYHTGHPSQSTLMYAENEDEERRQLEMDKSAMAMPPFADDDDDPRHPHLHHQPDSPHHDLYDAPPAPARAPPTLLSNTSNPPTTSSPAAAGPGSGNPRGFPGEPPKTYADPLGYTYPQPQTRMQRILQATGLRPIPPQTASEMRQRGAYRRQQHAVFAYILALIYIAILVAELVESAQKTGSAIQTHPSFNPMVGPGAIFLIDFGARSGGCMRPMPSIDPATFQVPCLNVSNADAQTQATQQCPLSDICKLDNPHNPDQTWRLFTPIFIHTGVIHLLVNVITQVTLCAETERLLGSLIFLPLYLLGGVTGNLLGADFGLVLQTAVGASGAIFTSIGVELVDVAYNWKYEWRAGARLFGTLIIALISIGLGLLPYMDNFAHIGGFATGILGGMVVCSSIHPTRSHRAAIWVCRLVGFVLLAALLIAIGLVFKNAKDPTQACHWCRYLSCLPVFKQCKGNGLTYSATDGSGSGGSSSALPSASSFAGSSPTGSSLNFNRRTWPTPYALY